MHVPPRDNNIKHPESPGIMEHDRTPVFNMPHDMIMPIRFTGRQSRPDSPDTARHAKVYQHGPVIREIAENILAQSSEALYARTTDCGCEFFRDRPAEIGLSDLDTVNPASDKSFDKSTTDGFNFWKFGQFILQYRQSCCLYNVNTGYDRWRFQQSESRTDFMNENRTSFGNHEVAEHEKPGLVRDVFTRVSDRYDLMNDVMSLGIHRLWKDALVNWLAPASGQHVLDLAGGTGDIAARILARSPGTRVTVR